MISLQLVSATAWEMPILFAAAPSRAFLIGLVGFALGALIGFRFRTADQSLPKCSFDRCFTYAVFTQGIYGKGLAN